MPKKWITTMLAPKIMRDSLRLAPGLALNVDMCLDENDGHILNATAGLRSDALGSDLIFRVVYNGDEAIPTGEREVRARLEAIKMAREWYKAMPRILKTVKRPLDAAEA